MVSVFGQSVSLILFGAGVALCILEAFAPGAHFIVLGVALLVAGLAGLLFPPLATPLVLGVLIAASGAGAFYVYRRFELYSGTDRGRTKSSSDLSGTEGYVLERVTPRSGRVKLDAGGFDPTYAARSIDGEIPDGAEIVVVDPGGGNVLTVEPIDGDDEIDRELAKERVRQTAEREGTEERSG